MFLQVRDVMQTPVFKLSAAAPLGRVAEIFQKGEANVVPVLDESGKKILGIVTKESLLNVRFFHLPLEIPAKSIMSRNFALVEEEAPLEEAWSLPFETVLVVNKKRELVGITTKFDLSQALFLNTKNLLEELRALFSSAHNGIIAINRQEKVTFFNEAAEKILRIKSKDVLGTPCLQYLPASGLPRVLKTGKGEYGQKTQIGRKILMVNRSPVFQDGVVTGAVAIFQDISELETISQELATVKNLNHELEAVINSSSDGIAVTDPEGNVRRANEAFARLMGVSLEKIRGEKLESLPHQDSYSLSPVVNLAREKGAQASMLEVPPCGKQLLITATPIKNEGQEITRFVLTLRDLTKLNQLQQELESTRQLSERYWLELSELRIQHLTPPEIIVRSPAMQKVIEQSYRLAQVDTTVLITGESGTGKEVIARFIHNNSLRKNHSFIKVNCGAIPENLLESELFGYEPGAFTGANKQGKMGMFELAHEGTIFLDEIGELPLALQVKLLQVLQDKEIVRLGSSKIRKIDVRIIAATNRNLEQMVNEGRFRKDLFYRLHVVPIHIPPLRERREDILPLLFHFTKELSQKYGFPKELSREVVNSFLNYPWPGNIRELQNILEQLFVITPGQVITAADLPDLYRQENRPLPPPVSKNRFPFPCVEENPSAELPPLKTARAEFQRQIIIHALQKYGNISRAAEALGVNPSTISRKVKQLGIPRK